MKKWWFGDEKVGFFSELSEFRRWSAKIYILFIIFRCVKKRDFRRSFWFVQFYIDMWTTRVNKIYSPVLDSFQGKNQVAKFTKMQKNKAIWCSLSKVWVSAIYFFGAKFANLTNSTKVWGKMTFFCGRVGRKNVKSFCSQSKKTAEC